jgi:capsular polysaccharide biosynthesis protein
VALGFGLTRTPVYEANIMILIGQAQGDAVEGLYSEVSGLQQLTQTMTEAVNTRPVAAAAIQELDLSMSPGELLENLEAEQVEATQFITVSYKDPNPERAQRIANAIGDTFSRQVSEVSPSANALTATVWERATEPQSPVSPNLYRYLLLALVAGGLLGVAMAFLLEHMDDSWGSPEEVEQFSGVPTFGVIPTFKVSKVR